MKKWLAVLIVSISCEALAAEPPPVTLNYQGYLEDSQGNYATGSVDVVISLFTNSTGGDAIFLQAVGEVPLNKGIYSFTYGGDGSGLAAAIDNPEVWAELIINSETLIPRQRLVSVPYSLLGARTAEPVPATDSSSVGIPVMAELLTNVSGDTNIQHVQVYTVPSNKTLVIDAIINQYDNYQANRPSYPNGTSYSDIIHTWIRVLSNGVFYDINATEASNLPKYGLNIKIPAGSVICCGHSPFFYTRYDTYLADERGDYKAILLGTLVE